MSSFDINSQNFYMIGSHGCAPATLGAGEAEPGNYDKNRYFTVPENFMIVYLTPNGVQSQGNKNIPFIKNLYDYNIDLFKYIFDPSNYEINLDKTNPASYRHPDFFKSLNLFSNFNYLCNFELYPPGVPCPFINLSFSLTQCSEKSKCYFEGITPLDNIITPNVFGENLNFTDTTKIYNPLSDLIDGRGFAYTPEVFHLAVRNMGISGGVFFVSACRAEFYTDKIEPIRSKKVKIVDINPIARNCGDITYDTAFINNLILEKPDSIESLKNVQNRLDVRNAHKIEIDNIILGMYTQNRRYFNNNMIHDFYEYMTKIDGKINICVNFQKIIINCDLNDPSQMTRSLLNLIGHKFNDFRKGFNELNTQIIENYNTKLYTVFGYIYRFVHGYILKYNTFPNEEIFSSFWIFAFKNYLEEREQMITVINTNIKPLYDFVISGGSNINKNKNNNDYKTKYLKYKTKYLDMKNKNNL